MRIFTASLGTETNTFAPIPTDRQAFVVFPPGRHPATPMLCSAPIVVLRRRAKEEGFDLVEGTAAWAEPAGRIRRDAYESLRDEIVGQLRAALPVDGVVLGLHGAMVADGYEDPEGDLLARCRELAGPRAVLAAEFDPHSHLTAKRFAALDILTVFKEFSHVDFVERAEELVDLTLRTVRKEVRPVMRRFDCRMIEVLPTSREPMRGFVDRMMRLEARSLLSSMSALKEHAGGDPAVLSVSCIHGFLAGDVEALGTQIVVVTDGDAAKADGLARELGLELFGMRGRTRPEFHTIAEAIDRVLALPPTPGRPAVVADVWDNPGGGVAGDSTLILREFLARGVHGAAFATIYDPVAVQLCHAAGEGAALQLRFGGKMGSEGGQPVDALVDVVRVVRNARQTFAASKVPMGDCALVAVPCGAGTISVVLNSSRSQTFEPSAYSMVGCDWARHRVLVVKSTNHFYSAFSKVASEVLYVDTGLTHTSPYPTDPTKTKYTRLSRPIWPIVADPHGTGAEPVPWTAQRARL